MNKENKHNYVSCLAKVPIFNHLSPEEQEKIVDLIQVKKVNKGDFLYQAGDKNNSLYIVHEGKIKISRYSQDGNEQVIRVLQPGDFIGEKVLFSAREADDFATSIEDCHLCEISSKKLKEHMLANPEIMLQIMSELSHRLDKAEAVIEEISLLPVTNRLAISLIEYSDGKESYQLPLSKADWASSLGMSQETLSRKLRTFKEQKLIELTGQRGIKILNRAKLINLCMQ